MSYYEKQTPSGEATVRRSLAPGLPPVPLQLWIEGVEPALSVRQISLREQLSDLFSITIVARSPRWDLDLEAMIFRPARLTMTHRDLRAYTGLCASAEQVQAEPT